MKKNILSIEMDDLEDADDDADLLDNKYLIFTIKEKDYGIPISYVTDITGMKKIHTIPGLPDYILGVTFNQDNIIPIFDLCKKFELDNIAYNQKTCIINLMIHSQQFAIITDSVKEVLNINNKEPAPGFGIENSKKYITHIVEINGKIKFLLDIEKIIQESEIIKINEIAKKNLIGEKNER